MRKRLLRISHPDCKWRIQNGLDFTCLKIVDIEQHTFTLNLFGLICEDTRTPVYLAHKRIGIAENRSPVNMKHYRVRLACNNFKSSSLFRGGQRKQQFP